jgi:hypothetical protein
MSATGLDFGEIFFSLVSVNIISAHHLAHQRGFDLLILNLTDFDG